MIKMVNPIRSDYINLGEGKGIKVTVWPNSIRLERVEKKEGKWETTEQITLAIKVLEWLGVRLPAFIAMMEAQKSN
ncbi:MAG: hypothetical protein J7K73_00370 [Nanoarchaeota archaeon]|nr:hypothetical protein [Nanoarchaeota archaeon]